MGAGGALLRLLGVKLGVLRQYPPRELAINDVSTSRSHRGDGRLSIALVTPVFNQAGFIERTMLSVLSQSYPELRYVVKDGGSTDGTAQIIERHASRLTGFLSAPDAGQADAINLGFEVAGSSDLMAYLNGDDLLLPGSLDCVARFFESHPEIDVVYGHRLLIDERDHEIGRWILPDHSNSVMSWADYIPQETVFWRRRIWDACGGKVDTSFKFAMDWDLFVRFRDAGARFYRLPRFVGAFRVHDAQKTSSEMSTIGIEEMHRIRQRTVGRRVSTFEVGLHVAPYLLRHLALEKSYSRSGRL